MTRSPTPSGHGGDQGVWRAMNAVAAPVAEKVAPTAQASPDGSADSPVTAVLGSDPVGPGLAGQAVPFQCRVRATGTGMPAMVCRGACPLAQMSVRPVPAPEPLTRPCRPSARRAAGRPCPGRWPALAGLRSATSYRDASLPPLAAAGVGVGVGVGTMVHAVPSQCAAKVSWIAKLIMFVLPTAQASVAVRAETA
jgi:hypothetical protein